MKQLKLSRSSVDLETPLLLEPCAVAIHPDGEDLGDAAVVEPPAPRLQEEVSLAPSTGSDLQEDNPC